MKLYVMRHGQTDWNISGLVQGHSDIPLNEVGEAQALSKKDYFNTLPVDLIITSPLKRAVRTAELISSDKNVPIVIDNAITERSMGELEGLNSGNIDYNLVNSSTENYQGVEAFSELCNRVHPFLEKLKNQDKNVLLVTHGGTSRAIEAYFRGTKDYREHFPRLKNCEIKEYTF